MRSLLSDLRRDGRQEIEQPIGFNRKLWQDGIGLVSAVAVAVAVVLAIGGGRANANNIGDLAGFTVSVASPQTAGTQIHGDGHGVRQRPRRPPQLFGHEVHQVLGPGDEPGRKRARLSGRVHSVRREAWCRSAPRPSTPRCRSPCMPLRLRALSPVTDVAATGKSGTSGNLVVNPAPLDHFTLSSLSPAPAEVAGTPFSLTVLGFRISTGMRRRRGLDDDGCVAFSGPGTIGSYSPIYPVGPAPCASGQSQLELQCFWSGVRADDVVQSGYAAWTPR